MSAQAKPLMTPAEYLAFEREASEKHAYFDGEIFAMSGASRKHNIISTNSIALFHNQLRGRPCELYGGDMRVHIGATGLYTYPDVVVVCGEPVFLDDTFDTLTNPTLLIEVLSPSTEGYDRGKKFQHYREIPSLRHVVLIAQEEPHLDHFQRREGEWVMRSAHGPDATLALPDLDLALPLAELYARVDFDDDSDTNAGSDSNSDSLSI